MASLSGLSVVDILALRELRDLTHLGLSTGVADVWAFRELKNPSQLDLRCTRVTDISALRERRT